MTVFFIFYWGTTWIYLQGRVFISGTEEGRKAVWLRLLLLNVKHYFCLVYPMRSLHKNLHVLKESHCHSECWFKSFPPVWLFLNLSSTFLCNLTPLQFFVRNKMSFSQIDWILFPVNWKLRRLEAWVHLDTPTQNCRDSCICVATSEVLSRMFWFGKVTLVMCQSAGDRFRYWAEYFRTIKIRDSTWNMIHMNSLLVFTGHLLSRCFPLRLSIDQRSGPSPDGNILVLPGPSLTVRTPGNKHREEWRRWTV